MWYSLKKEGEFIILLINYMEIYNVYTFIHSTMSIYNFGSEHYFIIWLQINTIWGIWNSYMLGVELLMRYYVKSLRRSSHVTHNSFYFFIFLSVKFLTILKFKSDIWFKTSGSRVFILRKIIIISLKIVAIKLFHWIFISN